MSAVSSQSLYVSYLGRLEFLKILLRSIVCKFLNLTAKQHLLNNERQLVVFSFDFIGHQVNLKGLYERYELLTTFDYLRSKGLINGIAIDVGANIGNHSLFFSKFYPEVWSFEPNARTFQVLSLNAELADNIKCVPVGLSDAEREAWLEVNQLNMGGSHISEDIITSNTRKKIQLKTLDSYYHDFSEKMGLLKMDVEGHELSVLKGAKNSIIRDCPIILFEQQRENFHDGKSEVFEYLKELGYTEFATVEQYPGIPRRYPKVLRLVCDAILRSVLGVSYRLTKLSNLGVDSYPFVVAFPKLQDIKKA